MGINYVQGVNYDGYIYNDEFNNFGVSLRPVISLPTNILQ